MSSHLPTVGKTLMKCEYWVGVVYLHTDSRACFVTSETSIANRVPAILLVVVSMSS